MSDDTNAKVCTCGLRVGPCIGKPGCSLPDIPAPTPPAAPDVDVEKWANIMRQKASGANNAVGMKWGDWTCKEAADTITRLAAELARVEGERDALRLASERGRSCIKSLIARKPVRDVTETLAELDAAISGARGG